MSEYKKTKSIHNILFLLNILSYKKMTKQEITKEFEKRNIKISKTTVNNYINNLVKNNINIKIEKSKNKNSYHILNNIPKYRLEDKTVSIFQEIKKIVLSQKDYYCIKNLVYIFYKISFYLNDDISREITNFGYFSSINWFLVNELEKHCYNKNLIEIEYILSDGKKRLIIIHADNLAIQGAMNRLYLTGTLGDNNLLSSLPVDRIFMVKRVIREKMCFNLPVKLLKYTVSKRAFSMCGLNNNEVIFKKTKKRITILAFLKDEFAILQRLLYFCPEVYYISDEKIKAMVVNKLKALEKMYEI